VDDQSEVIFVQDICQLSQSHVQGDFLELPIKSCFNTISVVEFLGQASCDETSKCYHSQNYSENSLIIYALPWWTILRDDIRNSQSIIYRVFH